MKRKLIVGTAIACSLLVLAQLIAVGVFWWRGSLTSESLAQLREILEEGSIRMAEPEPIVQVILPSQSDVTHERSLRILGLSERETLLNALQQMLDDQAVALKTRRAALESRESTYTEKLAEIQKANTDEATEQTRGILQKMRPSDAVISLRKLPKAEAIRLVRGIPDSAIAQILQQFFKGPPEDVKFGQEIFEALSHGEPKKSLLDQLAVGSGEDTPPR